MINTIWPRIRGCAGAWLLFVLCSSPAVALSLEGTQQVRLHLADGSSRTIGSVRFDAAEGGYSFKLDLDDGQFVNKFLSMRPFRCIDGPGETVCHLPYPYENRLRLSEKDMVDLEYSLLFIYKAPEQYGIDFFNGLYFRIQPEAGKLVGRLYEVDMDLLMAPPAAGDLRPIRDQDLNEIDEGKHFVRRITIE